MVTLIDAKEAAILTGFHRITIFKMMKRGDFPTAIYVPGGGNRPRTHFQKHEVEAWLAKRVAETTAKRRAQL